MELAELDPQARARAALAGRRLARDTAESSARQLEDAARRARLAGGVAGDPIERWVRARAAHFNALNAQLLAEAQALALNPDAAGDVPLLCTLPGLGAFGWAALGATRPALSDCSSESAHTVRRAVYAWNGLDLVAREDAAGLSPQVSDVWLSFSAAQLRRLESPTERARLRSWIRGQQSRGRRVALLLGDPAWLERGGGAALAGVLERFRDLPFDAIHLDLEPDQLTAARERGSTRAAAWRALGARIAETRAASGRPVIASIHWRALGAPEGSCEACAAAKQADEIAVMLYATNTKVVAERLTAIATALPGRPLWLAQSVEPELPPEESHYTRGRGGLDAALRELEPLVNRGLLLGFAIQSLEDYERAAP